jgi:hypothetical protein
VFVKDTIVRRNGQGTGGGIFVNPAAGATVKASLDNVRLENNVFGLKVQGTSQTSVSNSLYPRTTRLPAFRPQRVLRS